MLTVSMVTLVVWVSFTRPFSALYSVLHSHQSLVAQATLSSSRRGQEARRYFVDMSATDLAGYGPYFQQQQHQPLPESGQTPKNQHEVSSASQHPKTFDPDFSRKKHDVISQPRRGQYFDTMRQDWQGRRIESLRQNRDAVLLSHNQGTFIDDPRNPQATQGRVSWSSSRRKRKSFDAYQQSHVRFAVAVITTRRPASPSSPGGSSAEMDYVLQSAAALHAMFRESDLFAGSVLFVCNVDTFPENHAHAVFLRRFLHFVERFGDSSFNVSAAQSLKYGSGGSFAKLDKERFDYMFCLQSALAFNPRYVIMVEDDAVPHSDLPHVLGDVIMRITRRRKSTVCYGSSEFSISSCRYSSSQDQSRPGAANNTTKEEVTSNFAFLKLYLPEKWRGFYLFDPLRLLDLLSVGVVGASLYIALACVTSPRPWAFQPTWRTFFCGVLLSVLVACLVGRQNLNELRRISKHLYRVEPSPGCCTPAILYPADVIPSLLTWLADSPSKKPLDMRIDGLARHLGLPAFCVEPVLFRHIGMVSSLGHTSKQPEEFLLV